MTTEDNGVKANDQDAPAGDEQEVDGDQSASAGKEGEIDYAAELASALEAKEKAEKERDNYKKGLLQAKGKLPEDEDSDEDEVDRKVKAAIKELMPQVQATMASDAIDAALDQVTDNPKERALIKFHFENSVGTAGTIRERIENAKLIANKPLIFKKTKELGISLKNRNQISSTGQGSSSEGRTQVKDGVLSPAQVADLKRKGWDDSKINRLKENLAKSKGIY